MPASRGNKLQPKGESSDFIVCCFFFVHSFKVWPHSVLSVVLPIKAPSAPIWGRDNKQLYSITAFRCTLGATCQNKDGWFLWSTGERAFRFPPKGEITDQLSGLPWKPFVSPVTMTSRWQWHRDGVSVSRAHTHLLNCQRGRYVSFYIFHAWFETTLGECSESVTVVLGWLSWSVVGSRSKQVLLELVVTEEPG